MGDGSEDAPVEELPRVDWLRVAHRGLTLVRALRRDSKLVADQEEEQGRAATMLQMMDTVARAAVGCERKPGCGCAICREQRGA